LKVIGYAGLITGIVLALIILPQEDYQKFGISADFSSLLSSRTLTALIFNYGSILAFSPTQN
jgi:hypothetical protein